MPNKTRQRLRYLGLCGLLACSATWGADYPLPPPGDDLIGAASSAPVRTGDTLALIAFRYGLGFRQVIHANPRVDPWSLARERRVVLPTSMLLPPGPREGIVVNVPEMRLYYFPRGEARVRVYPVAVGRLDWRTPLGPTRVSAKVRNPVWHPPESIRAEHAAMGDPLERVVPAGPDNPLGLYALRLGWPDVLIHGTNQALGGIGMPVTHGCVRLYARDIQALFEQVPLGTPVRFIDEPVKLGHHQGRWYLEAHAVLTQDPHAEVTVAQVVPALLKLKAQSPAADRPGLDWDRIKAALYQATGLPVTVGDAGLQQVRASSPGAPRTADAPGNLSLISAKRSRTACSDRC